MPSLLLLTITCILHTSFGGLVVTSISPPQSHTRYSGCCRAHPWYFFPHFLQNPFGIALPSFLKALPTDNLTIEHLNLGAILIWLTTVRAGEFWHSLPPQAFFPDADTTIASVAVDAVLPGAPLAKRNRAQWLWTMDRRRSWWKRRRSTDKLRQFEHKAHLLSRYLPATKATAIEAHMTIKGSWCQN